MVNILFFNTSSKGEDFPTEVEYKPSAKQLVIRLKSGNYYIFPLKTREEFNWFHKGPFAGQAYYILHVFLLNNLPWTLFDSNGKQLDSGPKPPTFHNKEWGL